MSVKIYEVGSNIKISLYFSVDYRSALQHLRNYICMN